MKIAAVFSQFPRYDETFLLRELVGLDRAGIDPRILSLRPCRDRIVHSRAQAFLDRTAYFPWLCGRELAAATAYWLRRRPRVVGGWLRWILGGARRWPGQTARNLAILPKTLAYAYRHRDCGLAYAHGFWATYPAAAARLIGELLEIPWGFSAHAHDIYTPNALLKEKLEAARLVLTCSAVNRQNLCALAPAAASRIVTQYHGLDLEHFRPPAEAPAGGPLKIVAVGSLLVCKGYPALFQTVAQLVRDGIDCRLTVVGDGPQRRELEELAAGLGIGPRLTLAGYATEETMPPHYQQADVFVLTAVPRLHWGIPNVVLEALACGRPAVVTALPSLVDVFGEDGGCVFLHGESEAELTAAATAALTDLARRPEERRRRGQLGRTRVEEIFELGRCGQTMARMLRQAAGMTAIV